MTLLLTAAVLTTIDLARPDRTAPARPTLTQAAPAVVATRPPTAPAAAPVRIPAAGPGTFEYARRLGPVLGTAGTLRRFRIAVERDTGQDAEQFAAVVDAVLGDPRSWIAGRQLRLQRVTAEANADFTIFLATATTSTRMCATGGLDTDGYTSCRLSGQVIINLTRWLTAVPDYGAPLSVYREYAVNHEVGHELGYGHEACPAAGRPAPVMQQQTLGLAGCVANGWPYVAGQRYRGASIP